jgi:hypothetical protein
MQNVVRQFGDSAILTGTVTSTLGRETDKAGTTVDVRAACREVADRVGPVDAG